MGIRVPQGNPKPKPKPSQAKHRAPDLAKLDDPQSFTLLKNHLPFPP